MTPRTRRTRIPGITVYPRGKKFAYTIYLEPDLLTGKRRRVNQGGFEDEESAWTAAVSARNKLEQSQYVKPSRRTVSSFFDEWLEASRSALKPSTYAYYVDYLDAYVRPTIGNRKLQDITVPMLNAFYRYLLESGRTKPDNNTVMYEYWLAHRTADHEPMPKEISEACGTTIYAARSAVGRYRRGRVPMSKSAGLAPKTVKNTHRMLHRAFRDAVAWQYITNNPAEHASLPRVSRGRKSKHATWSIDQLAAWLDLALNDRYAGLWMLVATTGMRRGELAGLRREYLHLDDGLIVIEPTRIVVDGRAENSDDAKSEASERTISLDSQTVDWLRKHLAMLDAERAEFGDGYHDDGRLFCYPDGRAPHPETITRMFNRLVDRAGAPRIRLHDVRHTYATLSLDAGIDLKIVSDRLGHANVYVTAQIYGHRSTGHDRAAAETMASLINAKSRARGQN